MRDMVLSFCRNFGNLVNLAKFHLVSTRSATYLDMSIVTPTLRAFPSLERVSALLTRLDEFVLQAARCRLVAQSAGPPVVSVSAGSGRSSPDAFITTGSPLLLGLCE